MKDKKIYLGVGLAFLLLMTISLSYAYFSTNVSGNDNAKDVVVNAGTLSLVYTDGPEIKVENIRPGKTITKEVTVKNTGTLDTNYNIIWQSLINEITNNELVLSATCQRLNASGAVEGTCKPITELPVKAKTISKNISIEAGFTHKYTFTILFKETNANQNYNQGKEFNGVLGIEESKTVSPVAFSTDSWDTIVSAVKSGNTSVYNVGDTKEVNLGTTYGTHTLRIANTSTPSECSTSGFSQSACGFVLEFADIITTHNMNPSGKYNGITYNYGWNEDGWPASSMYTFVNNDIYNALPNEIKNAIIDTTVVSSHGERDTENFTSTDKLYLLSTAEVWADAVSSSNNVNKIYDNSRTNNYYILPVAATAPTESNNCGIECDKARDITRQLDYYKNLGVTKTNYSGAIKKNGTSVSLWWLRSAYSINYDDFYCVDDSGHYYTNDANITLGVAPAFRLG